MFESLVADIIAKYIGEYIKNLSSEQLKINIFSGNVVLKNLEIKGEALQSFKLPLHVQKGIIGTLTLKIPWTNIKSNPVILEIDSISLYAIPQTGFDYNEEEEKKKQIELKRKKLEKFELIRSFKEGTGTDLKQQKQDSFMSSVMSKILNNIQVKIANFHLRYEEIRGGKVYSLGISFGSLSALPVDSNWNVNSSNSGTDNSSTHGSLFKYIELTNFSIYLDSENKKESISQVLVSGNENTLFVGKMNEMIGTKEQLGKHQYILKPITVVLKIELNRNLDMNIEIPRMKVYCQFHQVSFIIEENQYQSILKLLTTIGNYAQEIRYLKYRPKQRPKQDPKAWWKYIGDVIRESIREKIQQRSWTFIQKRRQNRQEYILLFKKLQNVDWLEPITEVESKKLLEMEEIQLSFEDIIYFRSLARRELAMETQIADSKKGEFYATLNRSTTSKSFFGGWGSWATGGSSASSAAAVIPTPRMNIQLTKEQQAEIYKSMEYDEIALGATIEMPTHYVANVFEVQIDAVIFTIIGNRGPHENPLIKSHLNNINFKLSQRAQGFKLELDLESFNVLDNNNNNTLFPYVVTSNPKYKRNQQTAIQTTTSTTGVKDNTNLFHIIFESKPIDSSYDYALSLMLKSLEIIINKQQIERLVEFATPKENVNLFSLSSAALEEFILLKEMTIFQLREVVNHHKTIDLYIDAKAPILIIPEHYTTENITNDTNLIILDLGNFTMQSDISKKPRKQHGAHLETPFIINEQITKLTELNDGNDDQDDDDEDGQTTSTSGGTVVQTVTTTPHQEEDEDDLKISDLYDQYRASLSSIKVLLATHNQDWYIPDDDNVKGYQLIEEMSINLHIQSCIEPNELSLSLFKVSGVLPQVKMNLSDTSYLRLYRVAKTLGTIHSKATTTTITAYNHIMDIYSNTQDTFVQQVDAKTTEIKLSDAYKQVLSKRKIFDAKFKLEKVLINVISNSGINGNGNGNKLLQLRITELQVSLKKKTYDYNGSLLLGSLEVEDCQETSERFNCLITSQSRFDQQPTTTTTSSTFDKSLISIHTEMIDRESPHYNQVDTMVDFSFGELNFNYNPKSMGKIICFLDYCFEETFKIQDQFIGMAIDNNSSALSNIFHLSTSSTPSSTPINESPLLESTTFVNTNTTSPTLKSTSTSIKPPSSQQQQYNGGGSIIKAKASIYSLSISLNEQGRELGRFSINEFAIEECTISGRSLSVSGYLESISIDSFLDHPTEGFKILTRKNSGVSMAKFKYSTFDNSSSNNSSLISKKQQSNSSSSLPQLSNEFDKEIELYLCSIRLTVLVDFILKTKHLIELPFKTVKYDSLYKYQLQQQAQQATATEQQDETSRQFDLQAATTTQQAAVKVININDGTVQQPIGWKPLKINYKIFLESPQIILSSSDDIHSNHDRIIAELGSIDIKTTLVKTNHSISNGDCDEQIEIQWESIQANLYDMNVRTFKNGNYHQVLHNLSIYNQIDTVLCDGDNKYISFQKYPNQKKINVIVKEIKIEFIDLEHSLILSLTKDVISRITNGLSGSGSSGGIVIGKSLSLPGSTSNSLSSSTILLPQVTVPSTTTTTSNPLSNSTSSILFVNSDKEYSTTIINVGIDKFQLILKLDDQDDQESNDFATIELEKISVNMESCKKNDTNTNITIDDLILYDDRKHYPNNNSIVNKFSKIVEKKKNGNDGSCPFISVKFINYKDNQDWESSVFIEIQPATLVLSLGLILGIKDFFLLPFVTTLTTDQQTQFESDVESIEIPTLSSVLQDIKSAAIDAIVGGTKKSLSTKLQLSLIAKHPQIILPVSHVHNKFVSLDINGIVSLTNSFSPMLINDHDEFDYESMEIKLDKLKFNVYEINDNGSLHGQQSAMVYNDIKLLYPISSQDNSGFNIVVDYSSFDSIYINTIELLTCGKQPTEVDVAIDQLSIQVTEEQYQFFCDMISQLLRSLDDVPKLKLKKRNPYMLNVLLAQQQQNSNNIHDKILEIFGMKVNCKFEQVSIQLLSNDGAGIEFSKLVLDNVDLSIDMATENRPKKMLIQGTVDELSVYDCRQSSSSPFHKVLERYSKSSPMMEFSQTMYQSNSPLFPVGQLYSSLLNFKLSHLKSFALPSFSLRVWDWVIITITSVFSTYTIDKYIVQSNDSQQVVPLDEGTNNRMKMNVNIPLPLIIIPSAKDSTVTIEVRPNDIQISNEFILKGGSGDGEYQDVMNIMLNSLDMNLLTHNGITESNISKGSKLLVSIENFITEEQHEEHDGDIITCTLNNSKFTIKSIDTTPLEFKFNQTQYNHFYNCINNALKYHYEMDSVENQIFSKPNNQMKQIDNIITLVQLDSIILNLLDQDNEEIDESCLAMIRLDDLSLENIISSTNETMQVIGLIGNLHVEDTLNNIVVIQPISTDKFFTMFKYKTYTRSLNCIKHRQSLSSLSPSSLSSSTTPLRSSTISTTVIQDPDLLWDTEFEFSMKSVQFNLSLSNLNIPLLIQPFLLTILEKYPIETRPKSSNIQITSAQPPLSTAPLKMKIDISLLNSKINVSDSKLSTDKMIISFDEVSMKHQANQLNKIDDIGTLILDIESIKYKISSISLEIILSGNKPYFLLSDININASQRTIRNHLDIINKLYFDNNNSTNNQDTDPFESILNSDGTGLSDCFSNQELISKSKTSIHSNATQIDLHSNHYQFLLNLYNSINSKSIGIGKSQDDDGQVKPTTTTTCNRKEYLLNFIEFKLKDCSINLINKYNNIILNVQLKAMESYVRQIECIGNSTILRMDGSIYNLQISDQRRESCLLSKYQNLISNYGNDGNSNNSNHSNSYDHVHNKFNQLKFSYKPYVYNEQDEEANLLFNSNNSAGTGSVGNGSGNKSSGTIKDYKDKWNNHLILSISNSQIIPIFDLFTEIKDNFLPQTSTLTTTPSSSSTSTPVSRTKIELSMESNQFILPINFEIAGNYLRCEIKKMLISNDYQLESFSSTEQSSSYESNTMFLDINGFSMDCIMSVLLDSNQPRVNRIIRDSNINIITKMIDWESIIQQSTAQIIKPHSVPSIDTHLNIEYIDFLFCLEEYKFMYDTLNSTLKRYYDFKYLPLPPIPTTQPLPTPSFNELISIENKVYMIIQSFTMNMIKRSKPNIKESTIKPIGQIYCKKLQMSIDICKLNMKLQGSIGSMFIRSIKTKDNKNSLYLDILKPKLNFDSDSDSDDGSGGDQQSSLDNDKLIKFEYISHSEPVSITNDQSTVRVKWDTQYSVDIGSINLVSKISTLLKIKDFIMEPLSTPFVQPPSNSNNRNANYKPKMYQILRMKPWTLEIPQSEQSTEMISIEFGSISMINFYRLFHSNGVTLNKQIEVLSIDITQFTMYTQRDILQTMVSNSPACQMEVERLFTLNDRSLEDLKTRCKISSFELIFSADDYQFLYTIFTGNWMFNDLEEIELSKAPIPPSLPVWNDRSHKFQFIPLDHQEQIKISENQFSSSNGFINVRSNPLQTFTLKIDTFNFHMNPILDPLAILVMNQVQMDYTLYRDGIMKTNMNLKDVLLLDERKNTSCVFKEILTRKHTITSTTQSSSSSSSPPHIIIDYLMDPNRNRQFTSIQLDHPMLFVSPNSILPILDFFTSLQQPAVQPAVVDKSSPSVVNNKSPAHIRFYLKVTKPKLLLVEDETQQNTNALVMKMPIEFHFSKTSELNQTMELHASKCQLFRTTPFSDSNNGATSTPITNSFAFNCIYIQFNENEQTTIQIRFQPLNICLSYKEILMINRLLNNLSLSNYKEQQLLKQQQEQANDDDDDNDDDDESKDDQQEDGSNIRRNHSIPQFDDEDDEVRIQRGYRELEKKKKERKELSKSKSLVAPDRPDQSGNLMHKTRVSVEFLGRVSFTLLDESVTMKDIPFVQMNIGEFQSDYWGWEEYSFLSCDMFLKVEVFNQKHMAFDSLVEQFQLNLQILQSEDPKLKISVKSNSPVNINISQPFIQALANFYQNILKTNSLSNNINIYSPDIIIDHQDNNNSNIGGGIGKTVNGNGITIGGRRTESSHELVSFEPEDILFGDMNGLSSPSLLSTSVSTPSLFQHNTTTTTTTTTTTSNSFINGNISPTNNSNNSSIGIGIGGTRKPTAISQHQRNQSIGETPFNVSTSPGWKKPLNSGYLQQVDYYSKNSLSNNIINSKVRDMRSSVNLSLLNKSIASHQRSTHNRKNSNIGIGGIGGSNGHSRQNSNTTSSLNQVNNLTTSLNAQTLFTTEGNNQFWIVNLTGKSIEYYVEELNFVQSYNVNDSGSGLPLPHINLNSSFNARDLSSSPASSSNNFQHSYYNNSDDEEDKKISKKSLSSVLSQKEVHVLKNREKQALELNSVLFKTRDFRAHGSLNAHVAIRFIPTPNDPSASSFNDSLDSNGIGSDSNSTSNNSTTGSNIGESSQWIHGVSINQVGDNFYFPPFGNKANLVVCEVGWDEKNESKIATLRSPVLVKNSSNTPIDVLLISNNPNIENQLFGPVRVDENFYIPVDFWNYNSSISIRPFGKDFTFDFEKTLNLCESSSWPDAHIFTSSKETVADSINSSTSQLPSYQQPSPHSSVNGNGSFNNLPSTKSKVENFYLGTMIQSGIRCDRTGLISTTLVVTPPIIFENVLLVDIELRIMSHNNKGRKLNDFMKNVLASKPSITLTPGKQLPWYSNCGNDVGITLSLKGLGKDQYFHLPSFSHNSPLSTANDSNNSSNSNGNNANPVVQQLQSNSISSLLLDSNGNSIQHVSFTQEIPFLCTPEYTNNSYTLMLKIDHRFEGGCHIASIYCTNAIQNHTMIPFLLRPSNLKLANALTLETNEDPLMLSHDKFYCYHPSSPKVASKEFDIILGKEDIIEIQFEGNGKREVDQMRFQFKAIVSTGYNVFFRTRIVDIYPRFVLVNKLPVSLSYTQVNKDIFQMVKDNQLLAPDSSIPFHWFNGKEEQQLSISIGQGTGDQSWTWSGGMKIDQIGVNFLKLRHQYDDQIEQSIKVEVRDTSESTMIYFYSNDPQNLPFHIKNESFTTISFHQKHSGAKKYTLKPLESLYFTWDYPSGERKLTVQIVCSGSGGDTVISQDINLNKIKVFKPIKLTNAQLIFPIVESFNGTTRNLLFTTSYKERKELDLLEFAFDISFSDISFSLIDDVPQELVYIAFKEFNFWTSSSNLTETTWIIIDDIQIDNQQPDTEYPVLLWCDKKKDSQALPFLEYSAVKLKKKNIKYYDLIALYLNEMYIQLDDKTLLALNNFYQKIPMDKFTKDPSDLENSGNSGGGTSPSTPIPPQSSEEPSSTGGIPENFYIKWLIFAEIKIYLTFSISRDGILSNYNKMPALRLVVPSLGKSLGQLENAPLNINQLGIKNIFTTMSNLTELLSSHYTKQMKRQIHVILGSSNIFGSPLVFFNNISTGMTEAIEDPIMGSIQLMKRILYAAANSSSKLFGTISSGFATWSLDETYLRKRDAEEKVKAKHIAHGFYLGSKGFAMGIIDGVFGIVEHPVRGAMNEGVFGFFKGCGKGILGIAVKPVTGVFDFASKTSEGIRNNTNIHPERFRKRTPRYINPREPIKEYSVDESEGNFLLKRNSDDINKNEGSNSFNKMEYKFHVVLPDCTLLLTSHSVICLSKKGIYRWSFPLSEISKLVNVVAKCKLNIHLKNYRSFGTFSQLRKKISIHCPSDPILFQLYSKITSCFNKSNRLELEENEAQQDGGNTMMIAMVSRN